MKSTRSASGTTRKRRSLIDGEDLKPSQQDHQNGQEVDLDAPRYETFTIRFLLDARGICRRTDVSSIQHGTSDAWSGYDSSRLITWIGQQIELNMTEPVALESESLASSISAEVSVPQIVLSQPQAQIRPILSSLEIVSIGTGSLLMVEAGAILNLRFAITLDGAFQNDTAEYIAHIYLRRLGGALQLLGERRDVMQNGITASVDIDGVAPAAGLYRLSIAVTSMCSEVQHATLDGMLLHVYETGEQP
jgi:hypothetical protein